MNVKKTEETCSHHHLLRTYIIWVNGILPALAVVVILIIYDLKYQGEKTKVVKMDNNNNYNNDIKVQIMLNQYIHHPIYGGNFLISFFFYYSINVGIMCLRIHTHSITIPIINFRSTILLNVKSSEM
jgi:hypothetical protein